MQNVELVKKQFEEQINIYLSPRLDPPSPSLPFLRNWAKDKSSLEICEFGGGGGILLNEIRRQLKCELFLTNVELVEKYRPFQPKGVKFVHGSILNCGFEKESFDVVIARHLLHHLVGDSLMDTHANQYKAMATLLQIVRPKGLVLIEELVSESLFVSQMIYYLSRFIKVRINSLKITPYTVISLLTWKELLMLCPSRIASEFDCWKRPWYWKPLKMGVAFIAR